MSNILVSEGGGIWEGVYMTLAVGAYHRFLLHWSENLHPRFQIPNSPSEDTELHKLNESTRSSQGMIVL